MKANSVTGNVTESKNTFAGKTIAIATALVAVLSFGALGAYGAGGGAENSNTSVTANDETAAVVAFVGEHATAYVAGQPVNGTAAQTTVNQDFTFQIVPDDGYELVYVEAVNADGEFIAFDGDGTYTIAAEDVRDGITVSFAADAQAYEEFIPAPGIEEEQLVPVITIITPSATKVYDGEPLVFSDGVVVNVDNFTDELAPVVESIAITGSQTEVGSSENSYEIDWGGLDPNAYELNVELGTLTVLPNEEPIVIEGPTLIKTYDGTPLVAEEATVTNPYEGVTVVAEVAGEVTDAGTAESVVTSYLILDADGNDVSAAYPEPQIVNGTLTVNPATITVTTPSETKVYDGEPLTATAEGWIVGFVNGETATAQITGTQTEAGTSANTYSLEWDGTANPGNYTIEENLGTLEVLPINPASTPGPATNDNGNAASGAANGGGSNTSGGSTGGTGASTGSAAGGTAGTTAVSNTPGVSYLTGNDATVTGADVAQGTQNATAETSAASETEANPVDAVAEAMQNTARGVIGEDPIPLTAPLTAELDEDGTPLGAFDEPADNWVRWYVVVGIIATVLYGIAVLMRRRNFTKGLEDQENSMLGLASAEEAAAAVPADAAVRGA